MPTKSIKHYINFLITIFKLYSSVLGDTVHNYVSEYFLKGDIVYVLWYKD